MIVVCSYTDSHLAFALIFTKDDVWVGRDAHTLRFIQIRSKTYRYRAVKIMKGMSNGNYLEINCCLFFLSHYDSTPRVDTVRDNNMPCLSVYQ